MYRKSLKIFCARFFLISLVMLSFSFNAYCQKTHFGSWKAVDDGQIGLLNLKEDGYASFIAGKDSIIGEKFIRNGIDCKMTYSIDYASKPIKLDLIVSRLDNNEELGRLLGIIEFIGDKKMKIRLSFDDPSRPSDFMPEGNPDTIILEKQISNEKVDTH